MARVPLNPQEKERRKLERREKKKAERAALKNTLKEAQPEPTRKRKNQSAYKLIEVLESDNESLKKLATYRENGMEIFSKGYATGYFIYKVPSNLQGFTDHGSGPGLKFNDAPEKPTKTIADLVTVITEKINDGEKLNKRRVKLLVRGSQLKRNQKREAVTTLLKQFKIK